MNKKAAFGDILMDNAIYLILVALFTFIMLFYVISQMNGAAPWSEFYAKEISRTINSAQTGDKITLDIHKATEVAQKNDLKSFSEIFNFDNAKNEICVKLSPNRISCYSYFSNVDITNQEIKLGIGKNEKNILVFEISEKIKQSNENE